MLRFFSRAVSAVVLAGLALGAHAEDLTVSAAASDNGRTLFIFIFSSAPSPRRRGDYRLTEWLGSFLS